MGDTVYVPSSDFYVNGSVQSGTIQPVFWGSKVGGGLSPGIGEPNPDPPTAGWPDYVSCLSGKATFGGLQHPYVIVSATSAVGTNLRMPIYVPVPEGATAINSASIETLVLALGGGSTALTLSYDPLNGGGFTQANRTGIVAPDGGWVTLTIPGGLAAPTPGHFVKFEYSIDTTSILSPVTVQFTRLVVGWR